MTKDLESGLSNIPIEQIRDNVKSMVVDIGTSLNYDQKIQDDAVDLLDKYLEFRSLPKTNKTKYQLPTESKTAIQFAGALLAISAQINDQEVYSDMIEDITQRNGKMQEYYALLLTLPDFPISKVGDWGSLAQKKN